MVFLRQIDKKNQAKQSWANMMPSFYISPDNSVSNSQVIAQVRLGIIFKCYGALLVDLKVKEWVKGDKCLNLLSEIKLISFSFHLLNYLFS